MIKKYPEVALERFDRAGLWIKYVIFKVKRFLKNDILEGGAGFGSLTRGYMKNFKHLRKIKIITLKKNLGSQKSICLGLKYLKKKKDQSNYNYY